MNENMRISLDKLPIKRLKAIEENGVESFPLDVEYDENRISLIQRLDFAWAVDDSNKKQKKTASKDSAAHPWPWQSMVENLQLAHQELSVIIDLINSVEENNAVAVVGMTRPKQLPNEHLSDIAVSTATKLQCFRHLSKYLKRSAKALEQQVTREMRFYGALVRLQQNWKIRRQRLAVSVPSREGFSIDLVSGPSSEQMSSRSISMVHVDRDSSGNLSLELPVNAHRSLSFGFLGGHLSGGVGKTRKNKPLGKSSSDEVNKDYPTIDKSISYMHSTLCKAQRALFEEQVFELVKRDAVNPLHRINVVGMAENHLEISIGGQTCVFISLLPCCQNDGRDNGDEDSLFSEASLPSLDASSGDELENKCEGQVVQHLPCRNGFEIYLQQLFHQQVYQKDREEYLGSYGTRFPSRTAKDGSGKLLHFCISLAHRSFSTKVLKELENLVRKVPDLCLLSHMTWHSHVSAWTVSMKLPQSILLTNRRSGEEDACQMGCRRPHFQCRVIIQDDLISVEGEGGVNAISLCGSNSDKFPVRRYSCNLADLSFTLLQQFVGQMVGWVHQEAAMVGMKVTRDYLRLSFDVDRGENLSVVARLDPDDSEAWLSWWLVVDRGAGDLDELCLGHLSLEVLYSSVIDLVSVCTTR